MQAPSAADSSLMRQEIEQQPEALRATIDALLPRRDEVAALAAQTKVVLFIARGTSDNAAVYGSYLIQAHAGRLTSLAAPKRSSRRWPGRRIAAPGPWRSPTAALTRRWRRLPRWRS